MSAKSVSSTVLLIGQSIPYVLGSYAGLAPYESIARPLATLTDKTASVILFHALADLTFKPKGKLRLVRVGFAHSTGRDTNIRNKRNRVSLRSRWTQFDHTDVRYGSFHVNSAELPEGLKSMGPNIDVPGHANHWIFPYMLWVQPPVPQQGSEIAAQIQLSRRVLIRTTARTVARFAIFLGCSIIITGLHVTIVSLCYKTLWIKLLLIIGDLGRWLYIVGQVQSTVTYTLQSKGVASWGSPDRDKPIYGRFWNDFERRLCRAMVLEYIGPWIPGHLVFRFCDSCLWNIVSFLSRRSKFKFLKWISYILGESTFETFRCLDDDQFHVDPNESKIITLCLHVNPQTSGEASGDVTEVGGYKINFQVPRAMLSHYYFYSGLGPGKGQGYFNFWSMSLPSILYIFIPFIMIWKDGLPSAWGLVSLAVLQMAAGIFAYKDLEDASINCKFETDAARVEGVYLSHEQGPDVEQNRGQRD